MTTRTRCLLLVGSLLAMVLTGCSGGPRLGKVSGKVTFKGKPVPTGTIMFYPDAGPAAVGAIGPDGTYTLTTIKPGDGAVVGSHRVTIQATTVGPGSLADPSSFEEELQFAQRQDPKAKVLVPGKVEWIVPEKYSRPDTTDLTATVQPGTNSIDFLLPLK
jgi:hypothetical protein